ncbi:MAG: hypothetical protein AAGA06_06310 [Pseudomonadota bacterium]
MNDQCMSWLSDVAVFNESEDYAVPGDVSIYRNIEEMCSGMEAWMVDDGGIGFALNGLGQTIELKMDGENAVGVVVDASEPDLATLKIWLRSAAESVQEARAIKSRKKPRLFWSPPSLGSVEAHGVLPNTVEGLLAYIHM